MAEKDYDYDLIVIGSGPGGYVAAIRASQLGLRAAVVEKDKPGGVCLNIGCIPSKALIHQADLYRSVASLEAMGLKVDRGGLDYSKVFQASRRAADRLSKGVQFLLKKNKIDYVQGRAALAGPHEVKLDDGKTLSGRFILAATGSRPRELKGFEFDEKSVLSSTGLLMMEDLPKRLVILGSGYIGMEFAYVMNAFGVEVHVVEMLDQVLPLEDADVAGVVEKAFRKRGVQFTVSSKAVGLDKTDAGLRVHLESPDERGTKKSVLEADRVLVAVGRAPNTEGLGLEELGVQLDKGFVTTGDYYQTACASVFAIGDVVPSLALAHVASKEGEIAVEYMAGRASPLRRVDPTLIPTVIFTEPQIAGMGCNERLAKERGLAYEVATFPYRGVGKAAAIEQVDGFVKVLHEPRTREILGTTIVGAEATELIHEALLARQAELLPEDVATMIHAHPTLSEGVMEAFRAAEGWSVHA